MEADLRAALITAEECPALDLIRLGTANGAAPPRVELANYSVGRGKPLAGTITNLAGRRPYLILVDNDGVASRLDVKMQPGGDGATFNVPLTPDRGSVGPMQVLLVVVSPKPIPVLETLRQARLASISARTDGRGACRFGVGRSGLLQVCQLNGRGGVKSAAGAAARLRRPVRPHRAGGAKGSDRDIRVERAHADDGRGHAPSPGGRPGRGPVRLRSRGRRRGSRGVGDLGGGARLPGIGGALDRRGVGLLPWSPARSPTFRFDTFIDGRDPRAIDGASGRSASPQSISPWGSVLAGRPWGSRLEAASTSNSWRFWSRSAWRRERSPPSVPICRRSSLSFFPRPFRSPSRASFPPILYCIASRPS